MKWFYPILILFLLLGFPLFQYGQFLDSNWLVCENPGVMKSECSDSSEEELKFVSGEFDLKPQPSSYDLVSFFFQLKNPLSVLFFFFQGTSPFWRPPPVLILSCVP